MFVYCAFFQARKKNRLFCFQAECGIRHQFVCAEVGFIYRIINSGDSNIDGYFLKCVFPNDVTDNEAVMLMEYGDGAGLMLYPFTVSLVPLHTYYPIISDIMYGFILTVHYFGDEISPKLERNLNKKQGVGFKI